MFGVWSGIFEEIRDVFVWCFWRKGFYWGGGGFVGLFVGLYCGLDFGRVGCELYFFVVGFWWYFDWLCCGEEWFLLVVCIWVLGSGDFLGWGCLCYVEWLFVEVWILLVCFDLELLGGLCLWDY